MSIYVDWLNNVALWLDNVGQEFDIPRTILGAHDARETARHLADVESRLGRLESERDEQERLKTQAQIVAAKRGDELLAATGRLEALLVRSRELYHFMMLTDQDSEDCEKILRRLTESREMALKLFAVERGALIDEMDKRVSEGIKELGGKTRDELERVWLDSYKS